MLPLALGNKLFGSIPNIGIFLSAAQVVERVVPVAFLSKLCGSNPNTGIFLSAAKVVERVLLVAFGNKLCWFESQNRRNNFCGPVS